MPNQAAQMRTTIDIPDHLIPVLRRVARDRGISLSQLRARTQDFALCGLDSRDQLESS